MDDYISRQAAIDICRAPHMRNADCSDFEMAIMMLPPAQPEQRYTEEELRVFQHGISLSLLSKRSSQHWQYE